MELPLSHGPLLDGGEVPTAEGVEVEKLLEHRELLLLVAPHERVDVSSYDEVVSWEFSLEFLEGPPHFVNLVFVLLLLGTEVDVDHDEVVRDKDSSRFVGPLQTSHLLLRQQVFGWGLGLENCLPGQYQLVFTVVVGHVESVACLYSLHQVHRELLYEEDVRVDAVKVIEKPFHFLLLAQEGKFVERAVDIDVEVGRVLDQLVEVVLLEGVGQEGVEENEIIEPSGVLLCLCKLDFFDFDHLLKLLIPLVFELLPVHESVVLDADEECETWTVASYSDLLVDFPHVPLELGLVEVGEVDGEDPLESIADLCQFLCEIIAVELEGVVHDVAIVESSHFYGSILIHQTSTNTKIKNN